MTAALRSSAADFGVVPDDDADVAWATDDPFLAEEQVQCWSRRRRASGSHSGRSAWSTAVAW